MDTIIRWKALEHPEYQKTYKWYAVAGAVVLTFVIYGILTKDIMLSVVFVVFAGVYFLVHRGGAQSLNYELTTIGIKIENKLIPFADIQGFFIIHEPPYISTLNVEIKNHSRKGMVIQLGEVNVGDVREVMLNRSVPELEGRGESMSNILTRLLRI
ncbi:hypothetical protein HON22_00330 [Candidatus Peregrinibacteria bacterium]|jgi:hypothetical protein|nr:hypothetical protein [Candidatus Peregrinibacteria bacterium]